MINLFSFLLRTVKLSLFQPELRCYLCLNLTKERELPICQACKQTLPWIPQACDCCGLPVLQQGLCGQCIKDPPAYVKVIAPLRYEFPIAQLITGFKHQQQWAIGRLLTSLLGEHLIHQYTQGLSKPDYLLAIPLAKQRLRQRGFNQAAMISHWLSNDLSIPCMVNNAQRIKHTPSQQYLSAKERRTNLKHAFSLTNTMLVKNVHLALIDDVVTTGTTVNTLAALLLKEGASRVDVYSLARTPHRIK